MESGTSAENSRPVASETEAARSTPVPPELRRQALALSPDQRALLADELLDSVQESPEEVEAAWAEELERRLQAYERGELQTETYEEVQARIDKYLKTLRERQE